MKLPTKNEIITGSVCLIVGVLILVFLPKFSNAGWSAIFLGVTLNFFPGPQLRERYKQTKESKERWRQSAKEASSQRLSWWTSPFPWAVLIILMIIFANVI